MAWPTDKASNQYTDSGQDRIADARAEINQNITNVNDIIDEFNISSPSDGDILRYSSSTGQWEQVSSTSVGTTNVVWGAISLPGSIGDTVQPIDSNVPNNGELTVSTGTNTWTFNSTGTYYYKVNAIAFTSVVGYSWRIKNNTQSTYEIWDTWGNQAERTESLKYNWQTLTVTSTTDTYSFIIKCSSSISLVNGESKGWSIDIIKP